MDTDQNMKIKQAFEAYADPLFRHALFRLGDRELALDLTQQVFTNTWDYLNKGREIDHLKTFLYAILNNLIKNEWRRRSLHPTTALTPDNEPRSKAGPAAVEAKLETEALMLQLKQENESYAEVITLRHLDDLSVKEIAAILNESENVVSVRLHRAMAALRKIAKKKHE